MIPNKEKPSISYDISKKIFIAENALSIDICEDLITSQADSLHKRSSGSFSNRFHTCLLPLNHSVHLNLQNTLKEVVDFFKFEVDFVEPYEIKKYTRGDYFSQHYDNYYAIPENIDRKITLVAFLSNNKTYTGGNLIIAGKSYSPPQGTVIAFPSFLLRALLAFYYELTERSRTLPLRRCVAALLAFY